LVNNPTVYCHFHKGTNTCTYIVTDSTTMSTVIIDPVLDFDLNTGIITSTHAEEVLQYVKEHQYNVLYILDTHVHADHMTGGNYLKEKLGVKYGIGSKVTLVQQLFAQKFNLGNNFPIDGSQFDILLSEGDTLPLGNLTISVFETPGHTPACSTYRIGDAIFTGDTIFMPDFGTARCDFPEGSAETLFESIRKIFSLPDNTRVFVGHDYGNNNTREIKWESTLEEEKKNNMHVNLNVSKEEFVKVRTDRDSKLSLPKLLFPSVQININGGKPILEENGLSYFKIPITLKF